MPLISDMDRDADELQAAVAAGAITLSAIEACRQYCEDQMSVDLSAIPELATTPKRKVPEIELAVLAFGFDNPDAIVVWCNDGHVRWEISEQGPHEVATYILDNEAPEHGIWVWEGKVHFSGPDHNGEYDGPEYRTIRWRAPTEEEWEAMQEQRNPFEPKTREDQDWGWGRKTSF